MTTDIDALRRAYDDAYRAAGAVPDHADDAVEHGAGLLAVAALALARSGGKGEELADEARARARAGVEGEGMSDKQAPQSQPTTLHQAIKAVCSVAAPVVAGAALGREGCIYELHLRIADVVAVLCRYDGLQEALKERNIDVTVRVPVPRKYS